MLWFKALVVLLTTMFIVGCATPSAAVDPETPTPAPIGVNEDAEVATETQEAEWPPTRVEFDGLLTNFVRVCLAPPDVPCQTTPTRSDRIGAFIQPTAAIDGVDATMSWTPAGAQRDVLGMMIMRCDANGCQELAQIQGASPLALSLPQTSIPTNETLFVHAFTPALAASLPVGVYYELDQPFMLSIVARHAAQAPAAGEDI